MAQTTEENMEQLVPFDSVTKEFYKIVKMDKLKRYLYNDIYHPIYMALLEGPKTIEEITAFYNNYVEKLNKEKVVKKEKVKSPKKPKKKATKSKNTIYKYVVKELIPAEFISEYGKKIDFNEKSTSTKTAYHLTALFFIPHDYNSEIIKSEMGKSISEILGIFLSRHEIFNNKFASNKDLQEFFGTLSEQVFKEFVSFLDKFKSEFQIEINDGSFSEHPILKHFMKLSYSSLGKVMGFFNAIIFINMFEKENKLQKLKQMFIQEKNDKLIDSPIEYTTIKDGKGKIIENPEAISKIASVKPVKAEIWDKYLNDINYTFIISLLRSSEDKEQVIMLSIKDIHDLHYDKIKELIKEQEDHCNLYGYDIDECMEYTSDNLPARKTENTIYRYVRELVNAGLLVEAGRKIEPGKISSTIMYARSARMYIYNDDLDNFWESDQGKLSITAICKLLTHYFGKNTCDEAKAAEFLKMLGDKENAALTDAYENNKHHSILGPIRSLEKFSFSTLIHSLALVELVVQNRETDFIGALKSSLSN